MSSCWTRRLNISGSVCVCQGNRTTHHVRNALGFSSVAQPFDSLFNKVFDEHPTVATRKNESFVQRLLRITVCPLSTPLLKSTSTARWVTSAHGRALSIIAEGQHPATPCGHLCLRTHVSRCSQTHVHTISSGLRAIDTHEQSRLTSNSLSN